MKGMKYGYARVSTDDQDPAVQEQQLRELIAQRGWTLQRTYSD
jgi:DNA invertase Pin-like site-specific DNA recombinase